MPDMPVMLGMLDKDDMTIDMVEDAVLLISVADSVLLGI